VVRRNLTTDRIAAAHRWFNRIRQVLMPGGINVHPQLIRGFLAHTSLPANSISIGLSVFARLDSVLNTVRHTNVRHL